MTKKSGWVIPFLGNLRRAFFPDWKLTLWTGLAVAEFVYSIASSFVFGISVWGLILGGLFIRALNRYDQQIDFKEHWKKIYQSAYASLVEDMKSPSTRWRQKRMLDPEDMDYFYAWASALHNQMEREGLEKDKWERIIKSPNYPRRIHPMGRSQASYIIPKEYLS